MRIYVLQHYNAISNSMVASLMLLDSAGGAMQRCTKKNAFCHSWLGLSTADRLNFAILNITVFYPSLTFVQEEVSTCSIPIEDSCFHWLQSK